MIFQNLENPIRWLFLLHAFAGTLALFVFLIPILSKKGGKLHIKAGWIYTYAMVFVGFSAFIITPWRGFFDPARDLSSQSFALFLFFISVLTLSSIWFGLSVLRAKKRSAPDLSFRRIGPDVALIFFGILTQIVGYRLENTLLILFPIIGYFNAIQQIKYWTQAPVGNMHWWYAHMRGMGTACITTITAFLVTAVPRFVDSTIFQSPALWIAPGVVGGLILSYYTKQARAQFGD